MIRFSFRALTFCMVLLPNAATFAHGPQIQITNDSNKIVTRNLLPDSDYSTSLTSPKSAYVMPVLATAAGTDTVFYTRPNNATDPITLLPSFPSGPGFAYGYDLADGGPQAFEEASVLSLSFIDGLKRWDGATFSDAGATQLKAFRGSNINIDTPPENFAITSDSGPFDSLSLPAVAANYGGEGAEVHNSVRFALLGDGISPTSSSPDGVYLLSMQLSSTQAGLNPSDEYFFVLSKNAPSSAVSAAVSSLGFGAEFVQVVPEPASCVLVAVGLIGLAAFAKRSHSRTCSQC